MPSFTLYDLNPDFWARVQAKAQAEGVTVKALILKALTLYVGLVLVALLAAGCGSSTAPTPVTPSPVVPAPVPPTPAPVLTIQTIACPDATTGVELGFYKQIGCNAFDQPVQPVRRWMIAPKLYIRTVDEAGASIDPVTLDTVSGAMSTVAASLTAGKFGLASIERGSETREGAPGWITVKWPATAAAAPSCGRSQVAVDGGWIELNYKVTPCACNGSAMRPRTAKHELGHALGYWHTDSPNDLMSGQQVFGCDAELSARELAAISYQYR